MNNKSPEILFSGLFYLKGNVNMEIKYSIDELDIDTLKKIADQNDIIVVLVNKLNKYDRSCDYSNYSRFRDLLENITGNNKILFIPTMMSLYQEDIEDILNRQIERWENRCQTTNISYIRRNR